MRFRDRVALITAAGAGIGRATGDILSAEGASIVAVDTDRGRLDAVAAAWGHNSGRVQTHASDALDPRQVDAVVAAAMAEFGRIDILVNAVGGSTIVAKPMASVDELDFQDWQRLIAFNLEGTFLYCHAVTPIMKAQGGGKIVNLASIAGRGVSVASSSAYAAAKGGIIAFTKKLALELGPHGINVNAIAPSLTLTERLRPHWEKRTPEQKAAEIAKTPLRRVAEAADQARVIAFLASADADFVSGVTIDVTGGA